jgi:hypothetical protein
MPNCRDADLLQRLVREARKDRLVYLVVAESRLVPPEAKAPQPDNHVHERAQTSRLPHIIVPTGAGCPGPDRFVGSQGFARCVGSPRCAGGPSAAPGSPGETQRSP